VQSGKAVPKDMCLQATAEDRRWWRRFDMLRQTVPNTSCGDQKGSVADSWQRSTNRQMPHKYNLLHRLTGLSKV